MTQWFKNLDVVWKAVGALTGALILGMSIMTYVVGGKANVNAQSIEQNTVRIDNVEHTLDTIKSDITLVRCWAKAEIEQTDARACLFNGGRSQP